jgi:hypothetical protein
MPSNFTSSAHPSPSGTAPERANIGLTKLGNVTVWLTPRTLMAAGVSALLSRSTARRERGTLQAGDAGCGDETTILLIRLGRERV